MYYRDHEPGHFHATYAGDRAVFSIESLQMVEGRLPNRARRLVEEWASQHHDELRDNWRRTRNRQAPTRIAPLD
jgi:hypothetical protein